MWGNNAGKLNVGNSGVNVNTKIKNFTSDISSLSTAFWNQNFSLTISPAIGVDGNGIMQYDLNRQGKTALSIDACEALVEEVKNKILPVYNNVVLNGDMCPDMINVTIETGKEPKRNVIGVEMTPSSDGSNVPDLYFVLYGSVDSNNIASPANIFKHKFAKRQIRYDFNPMTGMSSKDTYANADFNLFMNMISHTELLLPYSDHCERYNKEKSKTYSQGATTNGGSFNFASSVPVPAYGGYANSMIGGGPLSNSNSELLPFN